MSNSQKPVKQARPVIKASKQTDVAKIHVTRATTTSMQGSAAWSSAPALQAAAAVWNQRADALEGKAKTISDLLAQLKTARADQRTMRRDWSIAAQQMIATAAIHCAGDPDAVHALGFDVVTHVAVGLLAAPEGLSTKPGKAAGDVILAWKRDSAKHGFIVQHAVDIANPATFSSPVPCTRSKYTLKGAQSSSVVHFRVAAIDPVATEGHSPWSVWVAGTAR